MSRLTQKRLWTDHEMRRSNMVKGFETAKKAGLQRAGTRQGPVAGQGGAGGKAGGSASPATAGKNQ
ncbi:hypothetical protein GCM10027511_32460 [Hymenobacter humi]